ncbi:hypothetical protein HA466_0016560 [Hirschfeldia incana]|nr:hypothetical protein HA466_0016560 [Hirschfeldia incana]
MEERPGLGGLGHMLTTVFLSSFAGFLVKPVITDVTVAAVCSGVDDSCSLAVYLTGLHQVVWNQGIAHASHVPLYSSSRFIIFSLNLSFEL